MTTQDTQILRELAARVAEIAAEPEMARRREDWYRQNALQGGKPLVFASPEGSWGELLPESVFQCEDQLARGWEGYLRSRIYAWEHFRDDQVIDTRLSVPQVYKDTGWGLEAVYHRPEAARGSYMWDSPLKEESYLAKLRYPEIEIDEPASEENLARAHEVFDGILDVQQRTWTHMGASIIGEFSRLRGLQQIMLDMVERPEWLHEAMTFMRDGVGHRLDSLEQRGLLSLNNGNDYNCSGAFGFCHDLPQRDFDGTRVRLQDEWGFADAQEVSEISPRMHWEFVLSYQISLLERFGLNTYGCCEPLHDRFEYVLRIPRLRRVSVSPWCDRAKSAEALRGRAVFSWKPNPARLAAIRFDEDLARREIRETLELAEGCVVEMVMKDTHTVNHEPERFDRWTAIAQEEAERVG